MQFTITRPKRETLFAKTKACSKNVKKLAIEPKLWALQKKKKSQIGPSFIHCSNAI